jgi:outer membrane protein, heavy metal efflux system
VLTRCLATIAVCAPLYASCATSSRDRAWLDGELRDRVGAGLRERERVALPTGIKLEDGLDEAEVVAISLWRNPALRVELTRIDSAHANLREAQRPANPQLSVMGPFGPVSAVATLVAPLESLWQLGPRSEAAARDADATGEAVLMRALDLVRDARLLHVELGLAADRVGVRRGLASVATEAARIAAVRSSVGDISPMDERVLASDAQVSEDAHQAALTELVLARARLAAHLALDQDVPSQVLATFADRSLDTAPPLVDLIKIARSARPDARAAELTIRAASARVTLEQRRMVNLSALVEGHWAQAPGPALRVGGRAELPIFGANVGGVGRAEAELERALAQHELVARTAVLEVTTAHARLTQALQSRTRFDKEVLPPLYEALSVAMQSFEAGDVASIVVLDVLRRSGEAKLRRVELLAEQRRALSELDRALGARLQLQQPAREGGT